MRLNELLEGSPNTYTGPRVAFGKKGKGTFRDYDPAEIKNIITKVISSPEYEELTKKVPMVSTNVELAHGLLSFEIEKGKLYWDINLQGNVRYKSAITGSSYSNKKFSTGILKSAQVNIDASPYARYIANIKEVLDKLEKRTIREPKSYTNYNASNITSLEDIDLSQVSNTINLAKSKLTSLVGCPSSLKTLTIHENSTLLSLEGCPTRLVKLGLTKVELDRIELFPQFIGDELRLMSNGITSLAGIGRKYIRSAKTIDSWDNPITESILGLMLVKGLNVVRLHSNASKDLENATKIIREHLRTGSDVLDCKEELIEKGFKDYAKL